MEMEKIARRVIFKVWVRIWKTIFFKKICEKKSEILSTNFFVSF